MQVQPHLLYLDYGLTFSDVYTCDHKGNATVSACMLALYVH